MDVVVVGGYVAPREGGRADREASWPMAEWLECWLPGVVLSSGRRREALLVVMLRCRECAADEGEALI